MIITAFLFGTMSHYWFAYTQTPHILGFNVIKSAEAARLSASALVSQADSLTDSSCHSDAAASAHDAAAEAYSANPAVVYHAVKAADSHPNA